MKNMLYDIPEALRNCNRVIFIKKIESWISILSICEPNKLNLISKWMPGLTMRNKVIFIERIWIYNQLYEPQNKLT